MSKIKNFEDFLNEELNDKDLKNEYDALEEEFTIAKEIIHLRKERHLTQKELAKIAGTSQPAIARLESGNYKNISLVFLKKIAKALGAEPVIHLRKVS